MGKLRCRKRSHSGGIGGREGCVGLVAQKPVLGKMLGMTLSDSRAVLAVLCFCLCSLSIDLRLEINRRSRRCPEAQRRRGTRVAFYPLLKRRRPGLDLVRAFIWRRVCGSCGFRRSGRLLASTESADADRQFEAVDVPRRVCAVVRHLFSSREGLASTSGESSSASTSLGLFAKGAAGDEVVAAAADRAGLHLHAPTVAV